MRRIVPAGALIAIVLFVFGGPARVSAANAPADPWVVDHVRFEPLDPAKPVGAAGVGDYRGVLEVGPSPATGGVAVINRLGVEEYLQGISEVPVSWPIEAQKAQAIAARSYLLSQLATDVATPTRAAGADICATDACQVYAGLAKERRQGSEAWVAAVQQTAGQVLLFGDQPIVAKYSSSNGGSTIGGGRPYLRGGVSDPFDAASPHHRWRVELPLGTVQAALGLPADPPLTAVTRSGNGVHLQMTSADGTVTGSVVDAAAYRLALIRGVSPQNGLPQTLPSMRYSANTDHGRGVVVMDGGGWGHGIGMSQWGALGRAQRGWKAPDILAAYYAGLRPVALPAERVPPAIRVAVALGSEQATVTSEGAFRVTDGNGRVLAHAATGAWKVVSAGRNVRLVPPAGQGDALSVTHQIEGSPQPDSALSLRVRVSTPALVKVTASAPGSAAVVFDQGIVVGERVIQLPQSTIPGRYAISIAADAGANRLVDVPADFEIQKLRPPPDLASLHLAVAKSSVLGVPIEEPERTVPKGIAVAAVGLTAAGTYRLTRRLRPRPPAPAPV